MGKAVRWIIWSGLISASVAAQDVRAPTRRDRPEVTKVRFEGVVHLDAGTLADGIGTQASHCKNVLLEPFCVFWKTPLFYQREYLDREELKRDVIRALIYYYKRGYRDAVVDTAIVPPSGTAVQVVFRVTEGKPTRLTRIQIDTPPGLLSKRALGSKTVRIHVGQRFDLFALDSTVTNIQHALWARGYAEARVDTNTTLAGGDSAGPVAAVRLTVNPGKVNTVGAISIARDAGAKVSEQTVRRSLTFREGALYKRGEVQSDQRTLYQSGMFRRVGITAAHDTTPGRDSVRNIQVQVSEAPLRDLQNQVGFSTVEFFQVSSRFQSYNFLGGGRVLTVTGGLSNLFASALNGKGPFTNVIAASGAGDFGIDTRPFLEPTWQLGLDLTQPWFLAPQNSLGVGLFARRRSAPGVFIDYGYGANVTFTRQVFDRAALSFRYQYELTKTDAADVYYCVNFGICDQPTIDAFNHKFQSLSPLSVALTIDHTNNEYYSVGYPTSGYAIKSELSHASALTLSDFRYNRAVVDAAWYHAIGVPRGVLALRARAGWVHALASTTKALGDTGSAAILNPRVRFYAGGANSVRGFGENLLGPRILTIPPDSLRYKVAKISTHVNSLFVFCPPSTPIQECPLNPAPIGYTGAEGKPAKAVLSDNEFTVRPLGGDQVLEGSVEYRFPLAGALGAALFVDGAIVGAGSDNQSQPVQTAGAITPGFGIRYYSSVGAIRIDLGLNPVTTDNLIVLTQVGAGPTATLVQVKGHRTYAPAITEASFAAFFQRVQLHLSIGQAF